MHKILYLFANNKSKVVFLLILMFVGAMLEAVELTLIIPLFDVMINGKNEIFGKILRFLSMDDIRKDFLLLYVLGFL